MDSSGGQTVGIGGGPNGVYLPGLIGQDKPKKRRSKDMAAATNEVVYCPQCGDEHDQGNCPGTPVTHGKNPGPVTTSEGVGTVGKPLDSGDSEPQFKDGKCRNCGLPMEDHGDKRSDPCPAEGHFERKERERKERQAAAKSFEQKLKKSLGLRAVEIWGDGIELSEEVMATVSAGPTADGTPDIVTDIEIARYGTWNHPEYGKFTFDKQMFAELIASYDQDARRQDLPYDVEHHPENGAAAWFPRRTPGTFRDDNGRLIGRGHWTSMGIPLVMGRVYKYSSVTFRPEWTDPESGKKWTNVLFGAALTTEPFVKNMTPVQDGFVTICLSECTFTEQKETTSMSKTSTKPVKADDADADDMTYSEEDVAEGTKMAESKDGEYGDVEYADEKNKKYPIDTVKHIRAALSYLGKPANQAKEKAAGADIDSMLSKIDKAWKAKIDPKGPPSLQKKMSAHASTDGRSVTVTVNLASDGKAAPATKDVNGGDGDGDEDDFDEDDVDAMCDKMSDFDPAILAKIHKAATGALAGQMKGRGAPDARAAMRTAGKAVNDHIAKMETAATGASQKEGTMSEATHTTTASAASSVDPAAVVALTESLKDTNAKMAELREGRDRDAKELAELRATNRATHARTLCEALGPQAGKAEAKLSTAGVAKAEALLIALANVDSPGGGKIELSEKDAPTKNLSTQFLDFVLNELSPYKLNVRGVAGFQTVGSQSDEQNGSLTLSEVINKLAEDHAKKHDGGDPAKHGKLFIEAAMTLGAKSARGESLTL